MKDSTAIYKREMRPNYLYEFPLPPSKNQYEDSNNYFFLQNYEDNKNTIYTLKNVLKIIDTKINKNTKNNNLQVIKEKSLVLPSIAYPKKESELDIHKQKQTLNVSFVKNDSKIATNNSKNTKHEKTHSLKSLNIINSNIQNNKNIPSNKKLIFTNSILENACNPITILENAGSQIAINTSKRESREELLTNANLNFNIQSNNNLFNLNKNNFSDTRSFNFSEMRYKENFYINNNLELEKSANNICLNINKENDFSPCFRKLKSLEKEIDNTNNNSIEDNDIGVIGLFSQNFEKKNYISRYKVTPKFHKTNLNLVNPNANFPFEFSKFYSDNPIKQQSIEFKLIKLPRVIKSEDKTRKVDSFTKTIFVRK